MMFEPRSALRQAYVMKYGFERTTIHRTTHTLALLAPLETATVMAH